MGKIYKSALAKEELKDLDDILKNYILLIRNELIGKQQFTTENIEKLAIIYLKNLFNSVKSFKICKRHNVFEKDIQATDINKKKIKSATIYENLKKYYIFVVKILKKYGEVSKEKIENLAIEWLCDFLRIESYKINFKNL